MPKKLDCLPCRAIGQDVPAQDEDQEKQGDHVEANMEFAVVGFDFRHKVVSRWASSEPYQSIGRGLPVPDVSEDDEKLDTRMYHDTKGEAPSCTHQSVSVDDQEAPYPSIGFDLPISEIMDDDDDDDDDAADEASICTSGEAARVQTWHLLDLGSLACPNDPNDLIRACHVSDLLAGNGLLLADRQDSQHDFAHSWKAEHIDIFISHNWSMHYKAKWILLKVWFSWRHASVLSVLACLPIAALIMSSFLPGWPSSRAVQRTAWSPLCLLIGISVFILSMRFGCKLRCMFLWSFGEAETCFYDRVCINQETAELKRAGILKLPAILNASGTLLVLHSTVYFCRLWTCFEFCCFLILKGPEYIRILPENYAMFTAQTALAYTLYIASKSLCYLDMFGFQTLYIKDSYVTTLVDKFFLLCLFCILLWQSWQWIGTLQRVELQLSNLKISECCCTDESDRPIVEGHLVLLAKRKGLVDERASHKDSLAAFEAFVRNTGASIINNYGGQMMGYTMIVGVCVASILDALESLAWSVQQGHAINKLTRSFLAQLAFPFFVAPISIRAYLHAALNLRARKGVGWIGIAAMELCVPGVLGHGLEVLGSDRWEEKLKTYIEVDTAFYIYLGALFIVAAIIYPPSKLTRCVGWTYRS